MYAVFCSSIEYIHIYLYLITSNIKAALYLGDLVLFFFSDDERL